jgi:hypothetical protein
MPGDHINERSCAIRDVVARDLRSASMETTGLFRAFSLTCYSRATPGRARPAACGYYPRHHRPHARRHASAGGGRATPAAAVHHDGREDALRGQRVTNELYHEGPHARQRPPAQGAGGGAGVAGEWRVHREGAHAGPRA